MKTVLVAPGAFKGTLSPAEAAAELSAAVRTAIEDSVVISCPIADGGDGTAEVLAEQLGGELVEVEVTGPLGDKVQGRYAWLPTEVAVIEMASASGLHLIQPEGDDALRATSRGTGELIGAALDRDPRRIIVAVGGSASSDAGAGILSALGVKLVNSTGFPIGPGAQGLLDLDRIDVSGSDSRLFLVELIVACDVSTPIIGEQGAARVFAPQKGATPEQVLVIEQALTRFTEVVMTSRKRWIGETPMGGAAGGAAAGMSCTLAAELRPGFDVVADLLDFDDLLARSDLLIVGEGSIDEQSLLGKAPLAAARRARDAGVPVWAFGGRVSLAAAELEQAGVVMHADLTELAGDRARTDAAGTLREVATRMLGRAYGG